MHKFEFTFEELKCLRICVSNAPIPYDITMKKIPASILKKIGEPIKEHYKGEDLVKLDLGVYQ
tara:strand:+ start:520 stop:708 length:189 start_codon:yes stop_codon:yes gene_type:complete